jgi:hypothetical protein
MISIIWTGINMGGFASGYRRQQNSRPFEMNIFKIFRSFITIVFCLGMLILIGCDSGEKVVDKVTGKQDVEQFKELKKDIQKIADQQAKKYDQIVNGEKK